MLEGSDIDPVVQISNGRVRGSILETTNGNSFYAFQGIPYAKAPVGDLRFKPPQRPDDWEGILDDRNAYTICIQQSPIQLPIESEDCLFLHVYTPELPTKDRNVSLPVIYIVHGGDFTTGTALIAEWGPHLMMEYGVIMVVVQYRLGFFGFLSTGDLACPGNNGLKDQQFGLKWVQENIQSFGGDPKRVTLFGQSSGAASISYQLLGSNSQGLFRSAIQDSGSALAIWTLQRYPRDIAFRIANNIDHRIDETNTTTQLMSFFKTVEVSQVKRACVATFGVDQASLLFLNDIDNRFAGVIEPEHAGAFLTETAYTKFESGAFNAVPTLMGINSEEALFLILEFRFYKALKDRDENTALLVPTNMHITDEAIRTKVGAAIRKIYVGEGLLRNNFRSSIEFFNDILFRKAVLKQAQLQSKFSTVYLYEFAYSGLLGKLKNLLPIIAGADGVVHEEELLYMFTNALTIHLSRFPEKDITTSRRMLTMWTNFVKYMNPTPEPVELLQNTTWPKHTSTSKRPYLFIGESLHVKYNLKKTMMDEYQRLYSTYAVPPLDTY